MTEWGMLLLCAYIALGATSRLTRRQAGRAAAALTVVVLAVAMVQYSSRTPTSKYIESTDSTVYKTGAPSVPGPETPTSEDVTGAKPATWFSTDHSAVIGGNGGRG
jgi:hypothetical protein